MRSAVMVALLGSGCLAGAGPSIAVRTNGRVALGINVSATVANVGGEVGQSYGLGSHGVVGHVALRGHLPTDDEDFESRVAEAPAFYMGGSLGAATGPAGMTVFAAGWPMVVASGGGRDCANAGVLVTVEAGIRYGGGITEIFVVPKANLYTPVCAYR